MVGIELVEVISLHDHVIELKEGKTFFPTLLVAFSGKHTVYGEVCTDFTKKVTITQLSQPITVIN